MPIIPLQGSLETISSREQPRSLRPEVQNRNPVLDGQAITDERVVENTFINEVSVNIDTYKDNLKFIAGLPEGRVLKVTYYSQNAPLTDIQSAASDMVMQTKDDTHISWTEIRDFEIRSTSEFNFDYQTDSNNSTIAGEGIVFAGFVPKISDIFLYMMRNSKIGVFRISDIQRLALGQDTYHKVNFTLQEFLTATQRDQLRRQTTQVFYFDKVKFVAGNNSLLTSRNYISLKDLKHYRSEIIQNYMDRFYDIKYSSFMRPDGLYDPYVVEYWNKKVSFNDNSRRPTQLLIAVNNYKKTIWAVLTNNPIKDLKNVSYDFNSYTYAATFWSINITGLLGNKFITVGDETAAKLESTIASNGTAILVDASPIFHSEQYRDILRKRANKMFDVMRHNFYGPFLPHRKCEPHQHSSDDSIHGSFKIGEYFLDDHGQKIPPVKKKPPFPIVSDQQLLEIWCSLNKKTSTNLSQTDQAKYKRYVEWYRKTYPGTLSKTELEVEYRTASNISSTATLTTEQQSGLLAYISAYRKQFLPILSNRELEIIWRIRNRVDFSNTLTTEQLAKVIIYITNYRDEHGYVPNDGITTNDIVIGSEVTTDEVRAAGSVIYGDTILLDPPSLTELVTMIDNSSSDISTDITTDENNLYINGATVPLLFKQRYPDPKALLHCHDVCHRECGLHACNDTTGSTTVVNSYALSKDFYLGNSTMDPFESLLYKTITNREVNPEEIVEAISRYLEWEDSDAFYRHLFCLYLIDKTIFWLRYHS